MERRVDQSPIYTIGYGNRSLNEFLDLLRAHEIRYLVDIRSQPYSRFHPDYAQAALENSLSRLHLRYIFLGDLLGGRPLDDSCYVNGKVDYTLVRAKPFYQQGIRRLRTAWEKQARMALMCSEQKPQACHRSKLIGHTLSELGIEVAHIDENGQIRSQAEIAEILSGGQLTLFDDPALDKKIGLSRKKYTRAEHNP